MNMNYRKRKAFFYSLLPIWSKQTGKYVDISWCIYVMTALHSAVSPSIQHAYPLMRFVGRAHCEWQHALLWNEEIASSEKENNIGEMLSRLEDTESVKPRMSSFSRLTGLSFLGGSWPEPGSFVNSAGETDVFLLQGGWMGGEMMR